jgi:hypothetical protein
MARERWAWSRMPPHRDRAAASQLMGAEETARRSLVDRTFSLSRRNDFLIWMILFSVMIMSVTLFFELMLYQYIELPVIVVTQSRELVVSFPKWQRRPPIHLQHPMRRLNSTPKVESIVPWPMALQMSMPGGWMRQRRIITNCFNVLKAGSPDRLTCSFPPLQYRGPT